MYNASIITISDKGFTGEIEDICGKYVTSLLKKDHFNIISYSIIPNLDKIIEKNIIKCVSIYKVKLVIIIGFSSKVKSLLTNQIDSVNYAIDNILDDLKGECIIGVMNKSMIISASENVYNNKGVFKNIISILLQGSNIINLNEE